MAWLPFLLNLFFKPKESACHVLAKGMGYILLSIGFVLGLIFLFQFLSPLIGHLETGALYCAFFFLVGFLLLILGRKKPTRPIDDLMIEAQKLLRDSEVDQMIRENAPKILLFSLAAGLILSQVKDLTKQFRQK